MTTPINNDFSSIMDILFANHLVVREEQPLLRQMVTAIQPLIIDGVEVCTDTILAERVLYATEDQMNRETETLTLKRAAFGEFEASMTPMPKYCFKNGTVHSTVLVHAVPKFTLDDVVTVCEQAFSQPYTYRRWTFYTDWVDTIGKRLQAQLFNGRWKFLQMAAALPTCIFPPPPHIPLRERHSFAALMLKTVLQHHNKGIYNDCISAKTLFLPTVYQPQLFANYAGIPAAMLADEIPAELLADDAVVRYGAQCRDVYCLALLCYRLVTGEAFDGRSFSLNTPRPFSSVLEDIVNRNNVVISLRTPDAVKKLMNSLVAVVRECGKHVPLVFAKNTFITWRKLNRASGGLWREIPILGTLCDIFAPTLTARVLRNVLDRNWFNHYLLRTDSTPKPGAVAGPELSILAAAFGKGASVNYPRYSTALQKLTHDSLEKRQAFGSLMELGSKPVRSIPIPIIRAKHAVMVTGIVIVFLMGIVGVNRFTTNRSSTTGAEQSIASPSTSTKMIPAIEESGNSTPPTADTIAKVVNIGLIGNDDSVTNNLPRKVTTDSENTTPVTTVVPLSAAQNRVATKRLKSVVQPTPVKVVQPEPVIPVVDSASENLEPELPAPVTVPTNNIRLVPAGKKSRVFFVSGSGEPCNPGAILPASAKTESNDKLFVAYNTPEGFSAIKTLYACCPPECDGTRYYEAIGVNKRALLASVKVGDVVSRSGYSLRLFLRDHRVAGGK